MSMKKGYSRDGRSLVLARESLERYGYVMGITASGGTVTVIGP
jgi:hypothetical protein